MSTSALRQRLCLFTVCILMKCSQDGHLSKIFWILGLHIVCLKREQFFLELQNFMETFMRLSFLTQFKIEFLKLFTGCRKVLWKMPDSPKWKQQLHPTCAISLEQYSRWSWLLVDLCKMMISPGFFSFLISSFSGCQGSKGAKKCPRWQKNSVSWTSYLRNHTSYDLH